MTGRAERKLILQVCLWLAASAGLTLALLSSATAEQKVGETAIQSISSATFVLCDWTEPPSAKLGGVSIALPDNWSSNHRDVGAIGWHRMQFDYAGAEPGVAVLAQRVSVNGEILVNSVRVLSGGRMTAPVARNWNTPFFVEVASASLIPGPSVVRHVELQITAGFCRIEQSAGVFMR